MVSYLACQICGSTEAVPIVRKFEHTIARCQRCGLIYANPRMPAESILARYSQDYFSNEYLPAQGVQDGQYDLDYFDRRYRPWLALVERQVGGIGAMLEIGAGAGFYLKAAQRAGWRVTGIELSEAAVAFAHDQLGLDVLRMPAEQLDLPDQAFDVVVMLEVIEHLFEPRRVLENARGLLRPAGTLVISTPNFNAFSRLALGSSWAVLSPGEHLYYFTENSLRVILEATGYDSVRFYRQFDGWGVFETLNPHYTHAPHSLRAKLYLRFVRSLGSRLYRWIGSRGWGDTLLCVARNGRMAVTPNVEC
jgi:SAM-dependent methyltransferase